MRHSGCMSVGRPVPLSEYLSTSYDPDLDEYEAAGFANVWLIDPRLELLSVYSHESLRNVERLATPDGIELTHVRRVHRQIDVTTSPVLRRRSRACSRIITRILRPDLR